MHSQRKLVDTIGKIINDTVKDTGLQSIFYKVVTNIKLAIINFIMDFDEITFSDYGFTRVKVNDGTSAHELTRKYKLVAKFNRRNKTLRFAYTALNPIDKYDSSIEDSLIEYRINNWDSAVYAYICKNIVDGKIEKIVDSEDTVSIPSNMVKKLYRFIINVTSMFNGTGIRYQDWVIDFIEQCDEIFTDKDNHRLELTAKKIAKRTLKSMSDDLKK